MRVKKNALLGTWEFAESDLFYSEHRVSPDLAKLDVTRILVVDDEATARNSLVKTLRSELPDRVIEEAVSGIQCLELFTNHRHSVITMDLMMPGMDGYRTYLDLKEMCQENKWRMPAMVFCTGYDPPRTVMRLVADDPSCCILSKPVSNRALVEAVGSRLPSLKPSA
jgi:CheY-like chemotaxis protein